MLAYALAALVLLQPSPQQFDLICVGRSVLTLDRRTSESVFHQRYRFDLDRQVWCLSSCGEVNDIHQITPSTIEFHVVTDAGTNVFRINRTTGALTSAWNALPGTMPMISSTRASCEVAAYTGISSTTRF